MSNRLDNYFFNLYPPFADAVAKATGSAHPCCVPFLFISPKRTRLLFRVCKLKTRNKGGTLWESSTQQIQDVTFFCENTKCLF